MEPQVSLLVAGGAALIPMIMGAIFYGPVFGKQWMNSLGYTEENIPEPIKMAIVYPVSLVLSLALAFFLETVIEHLHKGVSEAGELMFTSFHTFSHGAYHGFQIALVIVMPVLITNLMFQRNTLSNILLNVAYWLITISLMAGVMDAFA